MAIKEDGHSVNLIAHGVTLSARGASLKQFRHKDLTVVDPNSAPGF